MKETDFIDPGVTQADIYAASVAASPKNIGLPDDVLSIHANPASLLHLAVR